MSKRMKWASVLLGSFMVLALGLGLVAFNAVSPASAQASAPQNSVVGAPTQHRGPGGFGLPGDRQGGDEYLAAALGISVDELQAAQQAASDAAIAQALDLGLITQEQADAMILRGRGFPFKGGIDARRGAGTDAGQIDMQALLAEQLSISVDELQAAHDTAQANRLADAVANGELTQEQADMFQAREALKSYLDPQAIMASALGVSVDTLQSYRDEGLTLSEILDQTGMTAIELRTAMQEAQQAAVQQAVTDGVITQEQADLLGQSGVRGGFDFGGPGGGRGGHDRGGFGGPGQFGPAPDAAPDAVPQTSPDTTGGNL